MLMNVRALRNKIVEVRRVIEKYQPEIVVITEHWLRENEVEMVQFVGYKVISSYCRNVRRGGGVMIVIKSDLLDVNGKSGVRVKNLVRISEMSVERICEVTAVNMKWNDKQWNIVAVYRSPTIEEGESKSEKMNEFEEIIQNVILELKSKDIVMAGDFNVNFLNLDEEG